MSATLHPVPAGDEPPAADETSYIPAPAVAASGGARSGGPVHGATVSVPPPVTDDAPARSTPEHDPATDAAARTPERYRVERLLGSGAMGAVYLARDTALERDVALKSPTLDTANTEVLARFLGEARAAANLRHPNICPLYDVGETAGRPYLTMAYIPGRTLADFIKQAHAPSPAVSDADARVELTDALRLVRTLADAMAHAHGQGVVHRDLKPANVLMDERDQPFITDFGLARRAELEDENRLTREGAIVGTPAYMAPEQVRADPDVGPAADQYALGVILYELLTGRLPFGGTAVSILTKVLNETPAPPSTFRPDLPPAVGVLWKTMTARAAADRFASMTEVRDTLDTLLRRLGNRASDGAGDDSTVGRPAVARPPAVRPRRRGRTLLSAAGVAAAVGASFLFGEVWEADRAAVGDEPATAWVPTWNAAAADAAPSTPSAAPPELRGRGVRISRSSE